MKRRDFFKAVTGFVVGVCAAFVPKAKSNSTSTSCSTSGGTSIKSTPSPLDGISVYYYSDRVGTKDILTELPERNGEGVWYYSAGEWREYCVKPITVYPNGKRVKTSGGTSLKSTPSYSKRSGTKFIAEIPEKESWTPYSVGTCFITLDGQRISYIRNNESGLLRLFLDGKRID